MDGKMEGRVDGGAGTGDASCGMDEGREEGLDVVGGMRDDWVDEKGGGSECEMGQGRMRGTGDRQDPIGVGRGAVEEADGGAEDGDVVVVWGGERRVGDEDREVEDEGRKGGWGGGWDGGGGGERGMGRVSEEDGDGG
ncbi:hypothetical protein Tco_0087212 [Tanacetum coccineum]